MLMRRPSGAPTKGATTTRANTLVVVDHLSVPHRRRGAGIRQSLTTRAAHRRVVDGCHRRGGRDDCLHTHLPWRRGRLDSGPVGVGMVCHVELPPGPKATLSPGCIPAIDHQRRFSRNLIGLREFEGQLVAVIAVDEKADALSAGHPRETVSSVTLPVAAVAAALHQFDVRLDAIDIVSVRKRLVAEADPSSPRTADEPPAGVQHGTWLVLRMDPQHNIPAVVVRDSVASTLAAAVERLADEVGRRRCAARPLTGDELADVDAAVAAVLQPSSTRPGWLTSSNPTGTRPAFGCRQVTSLRRRWTGSGCTLPMPPW